MARYRLTRPEDLMDPVVVAAFDGWVDAGAAATNATKELAGQGELVVDFDGDQLFDYRARRPVLEIRDGRPERLTWPTLTIRRRRIGERDVLVLSGAEPDFKWQRFAADLVGAGFANGLVRRLGADHAALLFGLRHAVPSCFSQF